LRRSLEQHGQLVAVTLFTERGALEIIDGFKRVRAARALGWATLLARVDDVSAVDANREDRLSLPELARRMQSAPATLYRHRSWVWAPRARRCSRAVRSEADWMSLEILRVREIAARLEARLLATPLDAFAPAAAELMRDALVRSCACRRCCVRSMASSPRSRAARRLHDQDVAQPRGACARSGVARQARRVAARDRPRARRESQHRPHVACGARAGSRRRARGHHATPDACAARCKDRRVAAATQ
jgi:hypothetical protein